MNDQKSRRGNGFVDMAGQTFGHLTVLKQAPSIDGAAAWRCRCGCGGEAIVKGTALRKGSRVSCGCRNPRSASATASPRAAPPTPSPAVGRYWVVELDGFVALVESARQGEALVEFNADSKAWECSVHGPQGKVGCGHVTAVTARLPVRTALRIASIVAPARDRRLGSKVGEAVEGAVANEKANAIALTKSAIERAERVSRYDREHQQVTSPVTVRHMTPEDRERLAERRRHKRGVVGAV